MFIDFGTGQNASLCGSMIDTSGKRCEKKSETPFHLRRIYYRQYISNDVLSIRVCKMSYPIAAFLVLS